MQFQFAEPFRIKMVENVKKTTKEERIGYLKAAQYNAFRLKAEEALKKLAKDLQHSKKMQRRVHDRPVAVAAVRVDHRGIRRVARPCRQIAARRAQAVRAQEDRPGTGRRAGDGLGNKGE